MASYDVKKDYTADLEALKEESSVVANEKGLDVAIALILSLEKKCRLSNDFKNLKEVCLHAIRICKERKEWNKLNSVLAVINKRNSTSKVTITSVVAEALTYVDDTPNIEVKIEFIKALKDLCDGKIYVEGESAKLHFMLSKIYEDKGDIDTASDIVQDVHVETYGSLSKKEKAEYIVEQIRLTLLKKDYVRTVIHSRKMNIKALDETGFEEIKIRFYSMMIEYYTVEESTWEICQAYYKIATTTSQLEDTNDKVRPLESCILFLLLSKFDNHQHDMMQRLKQQLTTLFKAVHVNKVFAYALSLFTTDEIIEQPFNDQSFIQSHPSLDRFSHLNRSIALRFSELLNVRIVQHNIRVVAKYYKRIRTARFCELLKLNNEELESYLSELSSDGTLFLKIDRPGGVISFQLSKRHEEVLSEWSSDIGKLLNLMESTCHLINRENMVYKA